MRCTETQALWIQDAVQSRRLGLDKVPGRDNPSDLQTKYLDATSMAKHLRRIGAQIREGRPDAAPEHVPGDGETQLEAQNVDEVKAMEELKVVKAECSKW